MLSRSHCLRLQASSEEWVIRNVNGSELSPAPFANWPMLAVDGQVLGETRQSELATAFSSAPSAHVAARDTSSSGIAGPAAEVQGASNEQGGEEAAGAGTAPVENALSEAINEVPAEPVAQDIAQALAESVPDLTATAVTPVVKREEAV